MTVKDIMQRHNIPSVSELARRTGIPLRTLQNWTAPADSKAHRDPPEWLLPMINAALSIGYDAATDDNGLGKLADKLKDTEHRTITDGPNAAFWGGYACALSHILGDEGNARFYLGVYGNNKE